MKIITQVVEDLIKPYIDSHDRAAEAIIAPVETDATSASDDYAVGKQLILNNVLYDVIAPITTGDALVVNTNIKASDNVSSDIEALTKELEDEAATRSAQGAKNILPFDLDAIKALNTNGTWAGNVYTYRGVDFTVNSDGTISATGTATGGNASIKTFAASSNYEMLGKEVILNGCPSGGSASTYRIQAYRMASADGSTGTYFDDGAGTDAFTVLNNASGTVGSFAVAVYENTTVTNLLFKPMVRLASDPDDTYQQYAKTNRELTAENQTLTNQVTDISDEIADMNNVLGAKNLLNHTGVSDLVNGVTYTVNADKSISTSGASTVSTGNKHSRLKIYSDAVPELIGKTLILSGCPADGGSEAYDIHLICYDSSNTQLSQVFDQGSGATITIPNNTARMDVYVRCYYDVDVTGLTFKPMIRLASIQDDTYEPYSMTNQELTPIAQAVSNRNLLDNPWFTVNQRGFTSTNTAGYTVDRWQLSWNPGNITVSLGNDGITLDATNATGLGYFAQFIDNLDMAGKVVTASVLLADGTIKTGTGVMPTKGSTGPYIITGEFNLYLQYNSNNDTPRLYISIGEGHSVTIRAIKLELGSVSTLAQDTAPNYQQELAKCQRYFVRLAPNSSDQYGVIGQGIMYSDTLAWIPLNMPVAMRVKPSITYNLDSGKIKITGKGLTAASGKAVTAISVNDRQPMQLLYFTCASQSDLSAGDAVLIWFVGTTDAFIDLSADL